MAAPVVAVVGGGQLARMMAAPAAALNVHLRVLVEEAESSAAQVVVDAPVGAASDAAAIEALVEGAAVLTFEHEHVPNVLLERLVARGVPVHPGPAALVHAQDKHVMRTRLTELGVPCPRWAPVADAAALESFLREVGGTAVVKTVRGGYDGKGVRVVRSAAEVTDWLEALGAGAGVALIVEEKVPFTRELAVLVARSPSGEVRSWPVVESVQERGVCSEVIAPAPDLDPASSTSLQKKRETKPEAASHGGQVLPCSSIGARAGCAKSNASIRLPAVPSIACGSRAVMNGIPQSSSTRRGTEA